MIESSFTKSKLSKEVWSSGKSENGDFISRAVGNNSLLEIAERTGIDFRLLKKSADELIEHDLLKQVENKKWFKRSE